MTGRHVLQCLGTIARGILRTGAVLMALAVAAAVGDAFGAPAASSSAPPVKAASAVRATADTSVASRASSTRVSAAAKNRPAGSRQLETTHIRGDIPVPQVLFVTARDQRRFMSAHHQRYLKTSRTLAESTPIPSRMIVTRSEPAEAAK